MSEERKYWDFGMETMPLDKLRELQLQRLQDLVSRAYANSKFYKRKFDEVEVKLEDINTLDDLKKLPLIKSEEFRGIPWSEKLAVPQDKVKHISSTSGTTAIPQVLPYTRHEFEIRCTEDARVRWTLGVRPSDIVQQLGITSGADCCRMGYQILGASLLYGIAGRGVLDDEIRIAQIAGVTVLEHMPSLVLKYFERAKELGIDIKKSPLRLIVGIGEGFAEARRRKIEEEYGVSFMSFYGQMELSTIGIECEAKQGLHIIGDNCLVEIVDPETGETLAPGEEGEIVTTCLWSEATPYIRYRSGDVSSITYEPCSCGRTHPRLSMVRGRIIDAITIRDKKLFPVDVEEVVASIPELGNEYQIILDKPREQDILQVKAEYRPEVKNVARLKEKTVNALNQALGVESRVELVPQGTMPRVMFKAQRVITTYPK